MGYYAGQSLKDKAAQKIINIVTRQNITKEHEIKSILCADMFPTGMNFALCTAESVVYVEVKTRYAKNIYPLASITAAALCKADNLGLQQYVQLTIGGGDTVTLEIISAKSEIFISDIQQNLSARSSTQMVFSSADEIRKYKQLLDDGIITESEFETKKTQLLGI